MRYSALTLVLMVLLLPGRTSADAKTGSGKYCVQAQFGKCKAIRGLYGIYVENNGIWDVGRKRLLSTAGDAELDKMIYKAGHAFDHEILGDFTVCPLSEVQNPANSRTRSWQFVCVQSFRNTRIVKRR